MRLVFIVIWGVAVLSACAGNKNVKIYHSDNFYKEYTDVFYYDITLPEEQYDIFEESDEFIDFSLLSNKMKLRADESQKLLEMLRDTTCFKKNVDCTTYRDQACFIFYKGEKIINVISIGCGYSVFSMTPSAWPSNNGPINNECDSIKYTPLLNAIWKRIDK